MYVKQSTGAFANITADESSAYRQEGGIHQWFTQASGSADAAITLSERMRVNSNGLEIADGKRIVTKTTSGEAIRFERSSDSLRYSSIDVNSTDAGGAFIKLKVHTGASATSLADVITARGNGYVDMAGTSDVRVTIGSQGTAGTNDSNWIRGDASVLMYNSAGSDHRWEIGGTQHMELKANQSASVPMLSLTDAHPWIDMVAPDNSTWKSGITMRGGSSSTQAQCHFHMTRDSGFRTLSTAGDYDAYIDTTTANSAAYGDFLIGTDNVERSRITAYGAWQFYAKHQGDSVGHFIFSNQIGGDSTSANCTLMVKNGNCQVQIMPWSTLGARIGTRGGGWNSNSNNDVHFTRNDGMQIKLGGSGPVLSNGTAISSDERLKKNITDIADGQLAKINALKVRTFEWKNTDTMYAGTQEGFIAQEVESVIPEAVKEETMAPDPHDTSRDFEGDVKLLKHEVINARLIKAVQELSSELEAAKARIAALEG